MESETGSLADSSFCLGCGHEHNCISGLERCAKAMVMLGLVGLAAAVAFVAM
nr:MAG TPA: protein of unknown function DUF2116 [Caudoviricetes sp.]